MDITEATLGDRQDWDCFVDGQNGNFKHYFDWKYVSECKKELYIQLMVRNASNKTISIFPVTKYRRALYPALYSCGPLFEKSLTTEEQNDLASKYLEYLDLHYAKGCSLFRLEDPVTDERLRADSGLDKKINPAFIKNGFRLRYDPSTGLPCLHILDLDQPFDEKIRKRLWTYNLKESLRKARIKGITIHQDRDLKFLDEYAGLLRSNFKRHGSRPPSVPEIKLEFQLFKDRSKLFVALLDGRPLIIISCHYTPSTCYLWQLGANFKNNWGANKLAFSAAIEDACDSGYRHAHFGFTYNTGAAELADRFKGQRIPAMVYEKRYSVPGVILELAPKLIENLRYDKTYLRDNWRAIGDKLIHW